MRRLRTHALFPFFLVLLLFTSKTDLKGQCALYELSLEERVRHAALVVEGRITEKTGFWGPESNQIYSAHVIDVYKVLKGNLSGTQVELVEPGGQVGFTIEEVHPALKLEPGQTGIFFLVPSRIHNSPTDVPLANRFEAYGSVQGFIAFDEVLGLASDPFNRYTDVETELYQAIEAYGKTNRKVLKAYQAFEQRSATGDPAKVMMTPAISSFSPDPATAGTRTTVTINGSNFETYDGGINSVVFLRNADDGGATVIATPTSEILSWSDTQIQLRLPTRAGSGTFIVRNASGLQGTSGSGLTVDYNQTNLSFGGNNFEPELRDENGSGGYSFTRSTSTANNGVSFDGHAAQGLFDTALETWRCNTGFNVLDDGGTTTSTVVSATTAPNIVMFDNDAAPLPAGVLGRATSGYQSCDGVTWFVAGFDVQFRRDGTGGVTWNFTTAATGFCCFDFQSVALHELGHCHQLGHIIASNRVMHFALSNGSDIRTLDVTSDIGGGLYVMGHSVLMSTCIGTVTGITSFTCPLPVAGMELEGQYVGNGAVSLKWRTLQEHGNEGFEVQRAEEDSDFKTLGFVPGSGHSAQPIAYSYPDNGFPGGTVRYRLKQLDRDGSFAYSNVVQIHADRDWQPVLLSAGPSPFHDEIKLFFSHLPEEPVRVRIFGLTGQKLFEDSLQIKDVVCTIPIQGLFQGDGIYILEVQTGRQRWFHKLLHH